MTTNIIALVAGMVLAVVSVLILRELRLLRAAREAPAPLPSVVSPEDDAEITQFGHRPKRSSTRPPSLPKLAAEEVDSESQPSKSGVTIFEPESQRVDEPTGPIDLFVVSAIGHSDVGRRRKRNEDSYLVLPSHGLYVVADGMGGYSGGDVASKLAVECLQQTFETASFKGKDNPKRPLRGNELVWSIEAANRVIFEKASTDETLEGMGTTIIAARFASKKKRLFLGHVGDSRCYRYRMEKLVQLTSDHTMAEEGVTGPYAANLSRALGIKKHVRVDLVVDAPEAGDRYLLCSDGLSKMVPLEGIQNALRTEKDAEEAVTKLIDAANGSGGKDNVTVILLDITHARSRRATPS